MDTKTLIVIAGPTASGKTAAAIEIAKHYNTVVVSADSRQFYREMSIGTAKPSTAELAEVPHYFINSLSVSETYTAGDYEKECLELLNGLFKTHHYIVLAGGSGLFIKAICEGFDEFPEIDLQVRNRLNNELQDNGIVYLQEKLKDADPVYFAQVDADNPQRVIRALEVFESSGVPYSSFRQSKSLKRPFYTVKLGLDLPRPLLYQRINNRVDEMIKQGLVEEVKGLLPFRDLNPLNTVGYSELFNYLDGTTELGATIESIKQNTRRFAKRQLTWFRKDKEIIWFDAGSKTLTADMLQSIAEYVVNR